MMESGKGNSVEDGVPVVQYLRGMYIIYPIHGHLAALQTKSIYDKDLDLVNICKPLFLLR